MTDKKTSKPKPTKQTARELAEREARESHVHRSAEDGPGLHRRRGEATEMILRRASISRPSGNWSETDFDVFDGERDVGRIYRVEDRPDSVWFWGVSAASRRGRAEAKAGFRSPDPKRGAKTSQVCS
jgi:hypothetical protein